MLLTVTYEPGGSDADATVLGYLLHKHPARAQTFTAPVGDIHVFAPEARAERCTFAMMLEVDPVGLVRNKRFRGDAGALDHYVNDRPYVASSMLAVAIGAVFRTAMIGRSDSYPDLAASPIPLRIEIPVVSVRGDDDLLERLFAPCGWDVASAQIPLDPAFPEWGDSRFRSVTLTGRVRLADALRQLYVLLPVLDDAKHYWVGDDEVAKLERAGDGWLPAHPERELITRRYLLHHGSLVSQTLHADAEAPATPLRHARADAVIRALADVGARTVVDMGCGQGALLARLAKDRSFSRIIGVDVSARSLEQAARALHLDQASDAERERLRLLHGSVLYRDDRLRGVDAMVLMEVIEHVEPSRLSALEDAVLAGAAPASVVMTTPNAEYNALYPGLATGAFRHDDHRFEWTRAEFREWVDAAAARHGYTAEYRPVGPEHPVHGAPTQLALLRREAAA
ncbi:3' terminal RNA ribose 2'-O-methyltransferase Hen1 [Microbacterium sp. SORGH_AS 1204]|uniref:3' terminal RNA ribose 2'-O-methyltransferase Hen1 n=1 Tax=Microbacterium sp. SORGH_AS_1204 TaxID=3041785 RepID=UPI00279089AB|nr:3' terminal RNA ribose 2'-O-methyltransferase Hen1 [Microbacterium sp. SORGH_AS_1204]MDQ1138066.1 3' terminal RNA ribose 2'-O-methyltransferase Hen1 [Microbacterium sp. SORGH_AS_1204]